MNTGHPFYPESPVSTSRLLKQEWKGTGATARTAEIVSTLPLIAPTPMER